MTPSPLAGEGQLSRSESRERGRDSERTFSVAMGIFTFVALDEHDRPRAI